MSNDLQKIKDVWKVDPNRGIMEAGRPKLDFSEITKNVFSSGPSYSYIIDFETMQLSHVTQSIREIAGHDPETVTMDDIMNSFHPDDMDFIAKAEAFGGLFYYKNVKPSKLMRYKSSYNFRIRLKDGSYGLFNHQALMLQLGADGGFGKCLNVHTRIDHLTDRNNYRYSLISIDNEESFLNMKIDTETDNVFKLSKKEIEILGYIAEGYDTKAIAEKLFISILTVKKHRTNILKKSDCKNMTELVKISCMNGLIS